MASPRWTTLSVALTREQRRAIAEAARGCGLRPSVWARTVLVQAAYTLVGPARNYEVPPPTPPAPPYHFAPEGPRG